MAKSYGQFCGLARALDHIGDRWTLLIVRELLFAPASYGELLKTLDGIPTNLLADRLRELEADALVSRRRDPDDRRKVSYALTALGAELEPAVLALIAWGGHWMRAGQGDDRFEPSWGVLALRSLLANRPSSVTGCIELDMEGHQVTITADAGDVLDIQAGAMQDADAHLKGTGEVFLGLASGELSLTEATKRGLRINGDRSLARRIFLRRRRPKGPALA